MSHFPEIDAMKFPEPEVFSELADFIEQWGSQHQEFLQQLNAGHSTLQENWEGDGAKSYSTLHARAQDAGSQQTELMQNVVNGLKDVEEKTTIAKALLAAAITAAAIAAGFALFTFGLSFIAAGAAVALAVTAEGIAIAAMITLFGAMLALAANLPKAQGGEIPVIIAPGFPGDIIPLPTPTNPGNGSMPGYVVPGFPLPSVPPNVTIQIGQISTPNPGLWLNLATLGSATPQYFISSNSPTSGDWIQVNQFCSLMSAAWLMDQNHPANFTLTGNFTAAQINSMAHTLTDQDDGLQGQTTRAEQAIGGQEQPTGDALAGGNAGGGYGAGTRIWVANDVHAIGITIDSDTQFTLYDPNTGRATQYNRSDFENRISNVLGGTNSLDFVVNQA